MRVHAANFENGDPTKWVIIRRPLVNSGEAVGLYWRRLRSNPRPEKPYLLRAPEGVDASGHLGAGMILARQPAGNDPPNILVL